MATSRYGEGRRGLCFTASRRSPMASMGCWAEGPSMSSLELSADASTTSANRAGVYLAILQLVFTLGWTTYVIYLPKLAAEVGIAPSAVILILMLDQAIFTVTDTAMGFAADRIASYVG